MKLKNKTKKYKQKGGESYILPEPVKIVFDKLYNNKMRSYTEEETMTFELFSKNSLVITADTTFIKIEDIYEREKEIYSNNFRKFISDSKKIFNDKRISTESKYIKISDSFNKLCFDDSFKNKFIKHIINLRFITLYNHKILLLQLKQCITNMYYIIGNCDAGILEKNMPIQLRNLLFNFITNPIRNSSNSTITFIKTNLLLIEDNLSLANSPPQRSSFNKFIDDINSGGIETLFFPEKLTPQTLTIPQLTQQQITEGQQIKEKIIVDLQNKSIINSARTGFTVLVNFYDIKTVSALDVKWEIENDTVGTAIQKNNAKNSIKNALNAELTRIKILASDPNNTTHISAIVRSLGYALAPVSLGLSLIGGMIIDFILNKIYELDIIKTLNENKLYNSNFIESKQKFSSILFKMKEEIRSSSINSCRPDERINKYTQAYDLYNNYTKDCMNNYDNYLQEFINFKYIYNLLCDKTKEQIVNYIDSDIDIVADADEIVADADEDDIEQKVNKLYDRLQRGMCSDRNGVLILYHLKDITKGFKDGNERTEDEKKAILRNAIISTNGIVPKNIRCTNGPKFGVFINNYIKPFLDTPAIPVPAIPVPADEWDGIKQNLLDNTQGEYNINDITVTTALDMLRAYIKKHFNLQDDCSTIITNKTSQLNPIIQAARQDNKDVIKDYLCGKKARGGKKSKHNRKRKTQKQNRKTRRHR